MRSQKFDASWFVLYAVTCGLLNCTGCGTDASTAHRGVPATDAFALNESDRSETELNTESYAELIENDFLKAIEAPQSTFGMDVDTASYSNVRRFLNKGELPPKGAVRIEELVNYFKYNYAEPDGEHPLSAVAEVATCPWQQEHRLLRIGVKGRSLQSERPACNLVFLVDVSGSMIQTNKLPLVKQALKLLVNQLNGRDRIAIVVYAGDSGLALPSTSADQQSVILTAIDSLTSRGSTNGSAGIQLAYDVAENNRKKDGINRVILCTDGDFNVGVTNESDLVELISAKAKSGTFLSVLGFGEGNLKDSTMEKLADRGNGNYAYIDNLMEARRALVEQAGGTLVTIAKDAKIQVDFNPRQVQAYRLIGYENRMLANQDFRDDSKDAGEIGAGHTVTAFYELVPVSTASEDTNSRPPEFVTTSLSSGASETTMLTINLRYKQPTASESIEFQVRVAANSNVEVASDDFRFASAVAAYGMLLRDSRYRGNSSWDWVVATAEDCVGPDPNGQRHEFLQLAKMARRIMAADGKP